MNGIRKQILFWEVNIEYLTIAENLLLSDEVYRHKGSKDNGTVKKPCFFQQSGNKTYALSIQMFQNDWVVSRVLHLFSDQAVLN